MDSDASRTSSSGSDDDTPPAPEADEEELATVLSKLMSRLALFQKDREGISEKLVWAEKVLENAYKRMKGLVSEGIRLRREMMSDEGDAKDETFETFDKLVKDVESVGREPDVAEAENFLANTQTFEPSSGSIKDSISFDDVLPALEYQEACESLTRMVRNWKK